MGADPGARTTSLAEYFSPPVSICSPPGPLSGKISSPSRRRTHRDICTSRIPSVISFAVCAVSCRKSSQAVCLISSFRCRFSRFAGDPLFFMFFGSEHCAERKLPADSSLSLRRNPAAARESFFVGMQPVLRQVPPGDTQSARAVCFPFSARTAAARHPAGPAPITITS